MLPVLATPAVVAQLDRLYQSGETYQSAPTLLPGATPEAALRYVIFTYQTYQESGRVAGVALFLQDVTEQVLGRQQVQHLNEELSATNQELLHSNTRLTRANADLDTFIYTASHDLRSPVANIEGLLAALRQELLDEPLTKPAVENLMALIEGAINRFYVTIGQLTNIMHQQHQRGADTEPVDVAKVAEGVRLDLALLLQEAGGELLVDTHACPALQASAKDLHSIVFNLLSNAVKYRSPDRPLQVALRTACTAHWHELRVQDNGLGLSPAQQAQQFTLFKRLHTHVEGSGVGLYAIKKLIENAGGTIGVESQAGVGTTFLVRLPA